MLVGSLHDDSNALHCMEEDQLQDGRSIAQASLRPLFLLCTPTAHVRLARLPQPKPTLFLLPGSSHSLPPSLQVSTALIQLTYRQKKPQLPSPFLSTQPTSKFQYPSGMLRTATVAMPADISSFLGMLTQDFQRSPGKAWPLWQESKVTICCWP